MNTKLLLIAVAVVSLSSCSSVYKSGQTPDDVYYSPVRMYDVEARKEDDRKDEYSNYSYAERSQIRLGINNPRWRYLDDYSYSPYLYGYNYGYYYNPYYYQWPVYNHGAVVTVNPKNSTPRMTNLAAYNNNNVNANSTYYNPVNMPVRSYNNSSKLSNTLNKIFNNGSNYNNSNNSQNNSNQSSRSYTPSSNSNSTRSSSSGSSSSGGSTSRPVRNGKG